MTGYSEHRYQSSDGLTLFYREYGDDNTRPPILCLPGITRNSRDFEDLAPVLAQRYRVLAVDFRGRGFSDRDPDWRNYHPQTYADDTVVLLDALGIERVLLLGTSLGGLVSTVLSKQHGERIVGVILNDIGPEIGAEGLARIKSYIGRVPPVENWDQAAAQARETYGLAWRDLSDDMWQRLARRGYRENKAGIPTLDMDPKIGDAARNVGTNLADPWVLFDGLLDTPTLLIQGELSDILTDEIVAKMQGRKPDLRHFVVANRGHPPLLDEPECLRAIESFINEVNSNVT